MKKISTILLLILSINAFTQFSDLINDTSYNVLPHDLSLIPQPTTAFEIVKKTDSESKSFNAVRLNAGALGNTSYGGTYKGHACLDYEFPEFDRSGGDSIKLEFDAIWESASVGDGNSGKIDFFLMHSYPTGGPSVADLTDSNSTRYGKPAYDFRVFHGTNGYGCVIGGGPDSTGKFLFYKPNMNWTPGFLGTLPSDLNSEWKYGFTPGEMYPFFKSSWRTTTGGIDYSSNTKWKHYTMLINKYRINMYVRDSKLPATSNQLLVSIVTPFTKYQVDSINEYYGIYADSVFRLYHYFDKFNAIRMYWRGGSTSTPHNANIANFKVSRTNHYVNTLFVNAEEIIDFVVYPVPAKDIIQIKSSILNSKNSIVQIINSSGQVVLTDNLLKSSTINISKLSKGLYYVKLSDGIKNLSKQIIIE